MSQIQKIPTKKFMKLVVDAVSKNISDVQFREKYNLTKIDFDLKMSQLRHFVKSNLAKAGMDEKKIIKFIGQNLTFNVTLNKTGENTNYTKFFDVIEEPTIELRDIEEKTEKKLYAVALKYQPKFWDRIEVLMSWNPRKEFFVNKDGMAYTLTPPVVPQS